MYDIQSINNEKGLFMTVSLSLKEIPSLSYSLTVPPAKNQIEESVLSVVSRVNGFKK